MLDVILDALLDSIKVFVFVVIIYILFSFIEPAIAKSVRKNSKWSPLFGALFGIAPQCGISVVASDLYQKRHITAGTLVAVFLACSDEAIPVFLSNMEKAYMLIPLLLIKFVTGFLVGFLIDLIYTRKIEEKEVNEEIDESFIHKGCCHHHIEEDNKLKKHIIHPFIHSLKIFAYVLIINIVFGIIIFEVKEENVVKLLNNSRAFGPLFGMLVGLIPNCSSSVILSKLYLLGGISFGTCLSGLLINAGLGLLFLFKKREFLKENLFILGILVVTSLVVGYAVSFISWFN